MILGFIALVLGLLASVLIISSVYNRISLVKLTVYTLGVFFSINVLLGYWMDYFGFKYSAGNLIVSYSLVVLLNLAYLFSAGKEDIRFLPEIVIERRYVFNGALVFATALLIGLLPAYPSFYPVSLSGDSAHHFIVIDYIWDHKALMTKDLNDVFSDMAYYPPGMQINAALISDFLGMRPISFIYVFMTIVYALTALSLYGFNSESNSCRLGAYIPLVAGFYVLLSLHLHTALTVSGFWTLLFAGFLMIVSIGIIQDYYENPEVSYIGLLIILEAAIVMSNYMLALAPFMTFVWVVFSNKKQGFTKIIYHTLFYVLGITTLTTMFVVSSIPFILDRLPHEGGVMETAFYTKAGLLSISCIIFSLIGVLLEIQYRRSRIMLYFLIFSIIQTIVLFLGIFTGFGSYWYHKMYYLLVYPLAYFSSISFDVVTSRVHVLRYMREHHTAISKILLMLVLFGLSSALYITLNHYGRYRIPMSPDQYDVALWVRNNIPGKNVSFIANPPLSSWFVVVSKHDLKEKYQYPPGQWDDLPGIDFNQWMTTSKEGDILVLMNTKKEYDLSNLSIIYSSGDSMVLRKK